MARALVITHSQTEHVGVFAQWLAAAGLDLDLCQPWDGDVVPATLVDHDALLVMGGPQQAYDEQSASWLAATKALLRLAVEQQLPTLGICLGSQLLAEATGGRVARNPDGPELGARLIAMRDIAKADPLVYDLPMSPVVVQWHWDAVVELPPGAVLLASSPRTANQAYRLGPCAWGFQFHLETPPSMLRGWAAEDDAAVRAAGLDPELVAEAAVAALAEIEEIWRPVVERWAGLATTGLATPGLASTGEVRQPAPHD